jgi:hypothetical protein
LLRRKSENAVDGSFEVCKADRAKRLTMQPLLNLARLHIPRIPLAEGRRKTIKAMGEVVQMALGTLLKSVGGNTVWVRIPLPVILSTSRG